MQHLRQWKEVAGRSKQQREREDGMAEEGKARLLRLKAVRMLRAWRELAEAEASERLQEGRAICHYQCVLLHHALMAWKDMLVLERRKKLLREQCERFESSSLLSACYIRWRQQVRLRVGVALPE